MENGVLTIKTTLTVDEHTPEFLISGKLSLEDPGESETPCTHWKLDPPSAGCEKQGTSSNIVHPVQSAKIITKDKFSFRYGRIEFELKQPAADWLWPAVWLMPQDRVYGNWPQSGEIDIMEARGNADFKCGSWGGPLGRQCTQSAFHYGFNSNDKTHGHAKSCVPEGDLAYGFHKYAFEWTEKGFKSWVDNIVIMDEVADGWCESTFGCGNWNNPWKNGRDPKMTPFDEEFYLMINVAVGGGFFPSHCENADGSQTPWHNNNGDDKRAFWYGGPNANYNDQFDRKSFQSWDDPTLQLKSIRIFQRDGTWKPEWNNAQNWNSDDDVGN